MLATAPIQKPKGLDEILAGYKPAKADTEKKIEVAEGMFTELTSKYEQMLKQESSDNTDLIYEMYLNPEQINAFLQTTIRYENHENYRQMTGTFISQLLDNSYKKGYDTFQLDTKTLPKINDLCCRLSATKERPIKITIDGDTGNDLGAHTEHTYVIINGNTGKELGYGASDSRFSVTGDTDDQCAWHAQRTEFSIAGKTGRHFGYRAYKSTFKTPNTETLKQMRDTAGPINTLIYIHPDGTEETKIRPTIIDAIRRILGLC